MRLRGDARVERERSIDRQLELAGANRVPQVGAHQPHDLAYLVERAGAERDADVVDALHRMEVEVELGLHAAEPPDIDDAAEHSRRLHDLVDLRTGDHVDGQVHTLAAGRLQHLIGPFLVTRVDRDVRAEFFQSAAAHVVRR